MHTQSLGRPHDGPEHLCHLEHQYAHVESDLSTRVSHQLPSVQRIRSRLGAVNIMTAESQTIVLVNGPQPSDTIYTKPMGMFHCIACVSAC